MDRQRGAAEGGRGLVTIRVIVADDQELVRTGLKMILDAQPGIEVIGEAADGRTAVALARELRPDVCLFDIRMPGTDGIEATRQLAGPNVDDPLAVIVITTFDLDEHADGHGLTTPFGSTALTVQPPSGSGPAWRVPPSRLARSAMPTRP